MEHSKFSIRNTFRDPFYNIGRFWVIEGEYEKAINAFVKSTDNGYMRSCVDLGFIYVRGLGAKKDLQQAFRLFEASNIANSMSSNYLKGLKYFYGYTTEIDYKKALVLFETSHETLDSELAYHKSICYHEIKDTEKALKYLSYAAMLKHGLANLILGSLYLEGVEIKKDYKNAIQCLKIAANQNLIKAKCYLALCYQYGYGLDKSYEKSYQILKELKNTGSLRSSLELSLCYYLGLGVSQNMNLGKQIFSSAVKNNSDFSINIALKYLKGQKFPIDEQKVIAICEMAILAGHLQANYQLGLCYAKYFREHKSQKNAEKHFANVIDLCDLKMLKNIANIYRKGLLDNNADLLFKLYKRASFEFGDAYSTYKLAECYEFGNGVKTDLETSKILYQMAAEKGSKKAKTKIHYFDFCETFSIYKIAERFEENFNDLRNALPYYEIAATRGHKRSQKKLNSFRM